MWRCWNRIVHTSVDGLLCQRGQSLRPFWQRCSAVTVAEESQTAFRFCAAVDAPRQVDHMAVEPSRIRTRANAFRLPLQNIDLYCANTAGKV
jgi:hypothetical protein